MSKNMTRLLTIKLLLQTHITTLLYATSTIILILAGILFAFTTYVGVPTGDLVEDSPGVIERFKEEREGRAVSQTSPLLREATAFAQYLDLQEETEETIAEHTTADVSLPMLSGTPKFRVFGTCYFEANPEMSMALIDEPGKGKHWVRQSSTVGRFCIEQVRNGLVVVMGAKAIFELPLEKRAEASPQNGASLASTGAIDRGATQTSRI